MSKKYRTILLALLAFAGSGIKTNAQLKMVVNPSDGTSAAETFLVDDITKMAFADNAMSIVGVSTTKTFAFSNVKSIKFEGIITGIDAPVTSSSGDGALDLYCRNGQLGANGIKDGATATVGVYDLSGRVILSDRQWSGLPINITNLDKGVYLFKVNNKAIKFTK